MVPAGAQYPTDAVRLEPPQHGATLAEDPLPPADEALLPAAGKAPSASAVRSALASGERVLAGQAAARLGAAGAEVGEPEKGNPPTGVNSQPPDSGTKNIGFRQSNTAPEPRPTQLYPLKPYCPVAGPSREAGATAARRGKSYGQSESLLRPHRQYTNRLVRRSEEGARL